VLPATLFAALLLAAGGPVEASALAPDEEVLLFAASAHAAGDGAAWVVPVHGWVFEPERGAAGRGLLLAALAKSLGLDERAAEDARFRERGSWFLVDNERGKRIAIEIAGERAVMPPSGPDGHFRGEMRIAAGDAAPLVMRALSGDDAREVASITVHLVGDEGVSVISDIDDTIKASAVLDHGELLANTFLREFAAVPGMAEAYREWAAEGAAFHYVSSSPWQLHPHLQRFLADAGFPAGAMSLKDFRVKDESFFNLFASPEETKPPVIERILATWPKRRFIFVGDSGEKDPEVYGQVARAHPDRVLHIFIRRVEGSDLSEDRFQRASAGMPDHRWTLFDDPAPLAGFAWAAEHGHHSP
jgi:hypothetical protein